VTDGPKLKRFRVLRGSLREGHLFYSEAFKPHFRTDPQTGKERRTMKASRLRTSEGIHFQVKVAEGMPVAARRLR